MADTHFMDCCGLTDDDAHHTTARDVAAMSRELVSRYPDVYRYTGIWMEDIIPHDVARFSPILRYPPQISCSKNISGRRV